LIKIFVGAGIRTTKAVLHLQVCLNLLWTNPQLNCCSGKWKMTAYLRLLGSVAVHWKIPIIYILTFR